MLFVLSKWDFMIILSVSLVISCMFFKTRILLLLVDQIKHPGGFTSRSPGHRRHNSYCVPQDHWFVIC